MKRVKVDFSTTVKDGLIRANQVRASESLQVGDTVVAYDPAEEMEFEGVVDHLSEDRRFAYLQMQWEDNPPVPRNKPGQNLFVVSLSGATITAEPLYAASSETSDDQVVSPPIQVAALPQPVVTAPDLTLA